MSENHPNDRELLLRIDHRLGAIERKVGILGGRKEVERLARQENEERAARSRRGERYAARYLNGGT